MSELEKDVLQGCWKMASLLSTSIGAMIPLVAKGLAWNENLQQRTVTYLKLDELLRDIRYENSVKEEKLNRYVERYKKLFVKTMKWDRKVP